MLTHRFRTILGDIPEDWDAKPLRSLIAEQFAGDWGSDEGEASVAVLRSTNLTNDGLIDFGDVATRYFPKEKAEAFGLKKGDLLIERSGGGPDQPVGRVGFVERTLPETTVSNFVQVLRADAEKVHAGFLGWVLFELQRTGIVERVQQQSTQMRNLNWRHYQRLLLPWPEIDEQRRIAGAIRVADDAIQSARAELEATFELKRSLVRETLFDTEEVNGHKAFKYDHIPPGWTLHRLGNLVTFRQLGTNEVADHAATHTPILKMADLSFGELSLDNVEYVDDIKASGLNDFLLVENDFLFNTRNTPELVGKSAVWRNECNRCFFNNNILRMRFDESVAHPEFMNLEFASWRGRRRLRALATGTTSVAAIYWQDLARVWIALPNISYQREAAQRLAVVREAEIRAEIRLKALAAMKRSLLHNLLTGKIRIPEGVLDVRDQ